MSSQHVPETKEVLVALTEKQRIENLYQYLIRYEPSSDTLPHLPHDPLDRQVLFSSTSIAGIRHSSIRNIHRLEGLIRQNAILLVKRDVDLSLFSKPSVDGDEDRIPSIPPSDATPFWDRPDFVRPPTPIPPKVSYATTPRPFINLCTESDPSVVLPSPSPFVQRRFPSPIRPSRPPPYTIKKPTFPTPPPRRSRVRRCFICKEPGHYKSTCPSPPCYRCGKKGHSESVCPQLFRRGERRTPRIRPPGCRSRSRTRVGDITCNYPGPMGKPPSPEPYFHDDDYFDDQDPEA